MKIGKLYQFKKYFWMLFPSKDIAALVGAVEAQQAEYEATYLAAYYSNI